MSQVMYDDDQYVRFVLVNANQASFGFTNYTDPVSGEFQFISRGTNNKTGERLFWKPRWAKDKRVLRINKKQKCPETGRLVWEYIKNYPGCRNAESNINPKTGAPYEGRQYVYKIMDSEADANIAVKARRLKNKAETIAFDLEGQDLTDVAGLINPRGFNQTAAQNTHLCLEFASKDPQAFIDLVDSKDRKVRSLIREGVRQGKLQKRGHMIVWDGEMLGGDEDSAVSKLINDRDLLKSVYNFVRKDRRIEPVDGGEANGNEESVETIQPTK